MRHGTNRVISRRCSLCHFNLNASTMSPLFFLFFLYPRVYGYFYDNNETTLQSVLHAFSVVLTINLATTIYCAQPDINVELAL